MNPKFGIFFWLLFSISLCLLAQKAQVSHKITEQAQLGLNPTLAISQYQCDVWQKPQGLPQNSVFAITQSSDGYLWIATYEGLARFDGVEFTNFTTANVSELHTSGIWDVFEDSERNIWIGTNNGGLTRLRQGVFKTFTPEDGLPSNTVVKICEDKQKNIWIATRQGLALYKGGVFRVYTTKDDLSSREITTLFVDSNNTLWIGTSRGLTKYQDGRFEDYSRIKIILVNKNITAITEDKAGHLWIGTQSGLMRWNEKTQQAHTFRAKDGLSDDYITKLTVDSRGTLWIGTQSGGLHRLTSGYLTSDTPVFDKYTVKEGLTANSVTEIYEDHEGSLWIGMNRGGLNRLRGGKFTNYTVTEGLSDNVTNCVLEDNTGGIWIGTVSGGVSYFKGGRFRNLTSEKGLANNYIRSIIQAQKGNIWLATYGGGIQELRWENGKIDFNTPPAIRTYTVQDGLASNICRSIYQARDGSIWVGTKNGLSKLQQDKFITYTKNTGLADNSIICITEDKQGNIWVGTDGYGLSCIRKEKNEIISYTTKQGLANDLVFSLYEDAEGTIWVGTKNGLSRIQGDEIVNIQAKEGLANDAVHSITEDGIGNMWFSSNSGVFFTKKIELNRFLNLKASSKNNPLLETLEFTLYAEEDGMKSSDCAASSQPGAVLDRHGQLWFPTTQGVSMIDPRHIRLNYIKPPVVIKRFTADNSEVSLYKKIRLKAGTSKFEIDFAALSFLAPHKVKYRYKLEGDNYTEEWVEDKRSAYYTNLPPGIYRFKVQASNNDGLWNNTGAELRFYIEPRFYQTWWFFILCFLLLLGLGFGVYYFRIYALEQRQKELKQGIEESTRKILDQYNEITRQAEELNTIDKIVKVINQEVRFERVLQALLEQGLLLFPQANKGIFLVYHTEDENYTVAAEKGYEDTKILHQEVSPILLKDYAKYGLRIAEDIQILHPAISPKCLLDNYLPKASLVMKIRLQDHTQGIIFFDNSTGFSEVSSSDIQKLFRFKEHAVTAFSKALTLRELESKNHEVESTLRKMSDSIRYASRIQTAILSKEREIQNFFRDSFIFYRPKDIISGDFYWFTETTPEPEYVMQDGVSVLHGFKDPKAILAAVDCTGHGVPGAFMTVIGNDLLTSIISEEKITKAKTILETLDRKVKTYLRQEENTQSRDGMDMALLVIDSFNQTLEYAGAKNPIVYIRKGEMTEIKPSKYPIGGSQIQRKIFESHTIEYQDGDIFYLFSDGFQDQFGGEVIEGSHERKYTSKRLKELLLKIHQLPFKEQSEALEAEFLAWQGDNRQTDDVLVMGVKF